MVKKFNEENKEIIFRSNDTLTESFELDKKMNLEMFITAENEWGKSHLKITQNLNEIGKKINNLKTTKKYLLIFLFFQQLFKIYNHLI